MTAKTKSSLVLLTTLAIGIAVGVLASGILRDLRENEIQRMPAQRLFLRAMREIIQPSPDQQNAIDRILEKSSKRLSEVNDKHQNEVFATFDSMRTELDGILSKEQKQRLELHLSRGIERGFERRIATLTAELNLSEQQIRAIEKIMAGVGKPRRHRRAGGPPPEFPREMRRRFENMHMAIEEVLDSEQRQKYREMRMRHEFPYGPPPGY